jgi:hypothetical protein
LKALKRLQTLWKISAVKILKVILMKIKNKIAILSTLLMFQSFAVNAAEVDTEIAVFAAEQDRTNEEVEVFSRESLNANKNKPKTKNELKAEEKRLEKEREEARKKIKEERKKSRDELKGKVPLSKNPAPLVRNSQHNSNYTAPQNISPVKNTPAVVDNNSAAKNPPIESVKPVEEIQTVKEIQAVENVQQESYQNVSVANPMVNRSSFNELVQAVDFTPLYLPQKSGYSITSMNTINNRVAEICYSRKWEPNVSLKVRTYRRADGEELQDISGIHGVKWRVNVTNGITTYIAKIDENKHVAAWAVGNYTFSAYVENLSFATFYSIVADELVDLSQHYYLS